MTMDNNDDHNDNDDGYGYYPQLPVWLIGRRSDYAHDAASNRRRHLATALDHHSPAARGPVHLLSGGFPGDESELIPQIFPDDEFPETS